MLYRFQYFKLCLLKYKCNSESIGFLCEAIGAGTGAPPSDAPELMRAFVNECIMVISKARPVSMREAVKYGFSQSFHGIVVYSFPAKIFLYGTTFFCYKRYNAIGNFFY